jgi:hypothetical protein
MIKPVVIGATGIVTRGLKKNLEAIPGNHSVESLQKTDIFGTSHIIRKVLQREWWGSLMVQEEKYRGRGKKDTIIMMMIIIYFWAGLCYSGIW